MRYVDLPVEKNASSMPRLSVLGFGCATLLGRVGRRDSLRALAAAWDQGIHFFDTARSYGYGESEGLLGEFLEGNRHRAVLCTKFGILPPSPAGWKHRVKPLAQAAVRVFPGLRAYARRQAADLIPSSQFSVELLNASLESSLRALKTDYVDMLLLHAAPATALQQDGLFESLERLVEAGKVLTAGISADHAVIAATFQQRPRVLTTAQFAVNVHNFAFTRAILEGGAPSMFLVANHPFGGTAGVPATVACVESMRTSPHLPLALREKLTPGDPCLMPEVLLNVILIGTGISAVVAAMMRRENLLRNVQAIERCRFTPEEIGQLRDELIALNVRSGDPQGAGSARSS